MQCIAILLLDMTFQKKDSGSTNPEITASIKKMMQWLRIMKHKDPISEKADKVLRRILKEAAPALQALSNELLAHGGATAPSQHTPHQGPETHLMMQGNDHMSSYDADLVPSATDENFQGQGERQSFDYLYDMSQFPATQDRPRQMTFSDPFSISFDQDAPFANVQGLWASSAPFDDFDTNWPDLTVPHEDQPGNYQDTEVN
jgi:hypothetical protein